MIVMKFGGTSLANAERIKNVANIINTRLNKKPIVVVSAVGGITDKLIDLAKEASKGTNPNERVEQIVDIHKKIIKSLNLNDEFLIEDFVKLYDILNGIYLLRELSPRSLDIVSSFGEIFSSKILSEYLISLGIKSKQYNGWDIGIVTDNNFTNAEILEKTYDNIKDKLTNVKDLPVVTGFIANDEEGNITTLGRGGSDYTASIIGSALDVEEIEIWTDVNGIKTADPRIVENARQWDKITFNEAAEMAFFGAKVLHPKTIRPAITKSIPVRILNTYEIENRGTSIVNEDNEDVLFRSISLKKDVTVIRICSTKMLMAYGFLARIFEIFRKYKISIDIVSTSEVTVSLTLDKVNNGLKNLQSAILELEKIAKVEVLKERSIICIVGKGIRDKSGILKRIFDVCRNYNIELVSHGVSPLNISFVVKQEDAENIIKELHKELFEK